MEKVEFFIVSQLKTTAIICLVVLLMTSCTKTSQRSFDDLVSTYSELGDNHQLGLDCILEDLKSVYANVAEKPDPYQLSKTVKSTSARFTMEMLGLNAGIENELFKIQESINIPLAKTDVSPSILDLTNGQISFSANEIKYLARLDQILANVSSGVNQCVQNIKNLEHEIYLSCSEQEINLLFTATSIGASSIVYWYNNYDIWAQELPFLEMSDKKGIAHKEWFWASLNRMGRADIAGGLSGAFFGAFAAGIGAIPGALAGACTASGNCGLICLYEHLIEE